MTQLYLTRRNLLSLLSKLDRKTNGGETKCTLIKNDTKHSKYPNSESNIIVTAVEDSDYYTEREAGDVHPDDVP